MHCKHLHTHILSTYPPCTPTHPLPPTLSHSPSPTHSHRHPPSPAQVLLDKKYALPYRVIDALVDHFVGFKHETRHLPVVWHAALLCFVQRYKHEIRAEDKSALRGLLKSQHHYKVSRGCCVCEGWEHACVEGVICEGERGWGHDIPQDFTPQTFTPQKITPNPP